MGLEVVIHLMVNIRKETQLKVKKKNFPGSLLTCLLLLRSFLTCLLLHQDLVCLMAGMGTLRSRNQ